MSVAVTLDLLAASPPYEQVRAQLAGHIRTGALRPGDKLPVVRTLAADLGVATNTIARAYRELEAGGLVTTRRRVGTIVQAPPAPAGPELQHQAARFVREARLAGLADEEVVDLVRGALSADDLDTATPARATPVSRATPVTTSEG
ncbi:GntR family transcriptional regulator [Nocardioides mesophilus]|uniref:GntR family transcriptional regulator n=1 Tax=Nocardioides mesophilus TaxID=433659 RepID=A0A7G9RG15_9ACTN|nr:GntR family transcriptional regulator [Nocardioides mesophilus]QNN54540.1 GntR family transcriptional regulator [Nocardioides mesophilus]